MNSKLTALTDVELSLSKITASCVKKYATSSVHERNQREDHGIVYVLQGQATYYRERQQDLVVGKNDIFLLSQGSTYCRVVDAASPFEFILISFLTTENKLSIPLNEFIHVTNPDYYRSSFLEMVKIWSNQWLGYKLRCSAIFMNIFFQLLYDTVGQQLSKQTRDEMQLQPAMEYMEQNYRSSILVHELAEQTNLSTSHFHRLFKHTFGISPLQYLLTLRIERAKPLCSSGAYTVQEVAEQVGFDDAYYFSRVFKKVTGLSPTDYGRQR